MWNKGCCYEYGSGNRSCGLLFSSIHVKQTTLLSAHPGNRSRQWAKKESSSGGKQQQEDANRNDDLMLLLSCAS